MPDVINVGLSYRKKLIYLFCFHCYRSQEYYSPWSLKFQPSAFFLEEIPPFHHSTDKSSNPHEKLHTITTAIYKVSLSPSDVCEFFLYYLLAFVTSIYANKSHKSHKPSYHVDYENKFTL